MRSAADVLASSQLRSKWMSSASVVHLAMSAAMRVLNCSGLDGQLRSRSVAGCPILQRRRPRARDADEFADRSKRIIGIRRHDVRILRRHADHGEVIDRAVGKFLEGGRGKGVAGGYGAKRIGIGCGACDLGDRRGAVGVRMALVHYLLATRS